ncbi:hypothetical protein PINS_up012790 [Pythium insidiosum]|nr:hypothetical protein PINS_up012790 [Pythium insidiosum]
MDDAKNKEKQEVSADAADNASDQKVGHAAAIGEAAVSESVVKSTQQEASEACDEPSSAPLDGGAEKEEREREEVVETTNGKKLQAVSAEPNEAVSKKGDATTTSTTDDAPVKKTSVDVSSIKMDILKALAEARTAIAGIKKETTVTDKSAAIEAPKQVQPTVRNEEAETATPSQGPDGTDVSSQSVSPPTKQVASADVDEFDMFSAAELHDRGLSPVAFPSAADQAVDAVVGSNCDDPEGYYQPTTGEVLNGTYRVLGAVGKGVFSTVLRCQRLANNDDSPSFVAIKLIRNNEVMREAAQLEVRILTELAERDPRDKKHCVRLLERFEHRGHVALVFESMQMNLREAMKKFGGRGGISVQAVRVFCKHMLIALSHLESSGVVHADIKPDNILLDEKQTMIKLCDFGSAFKVDEGKHDPTPYLVSRFYRAPEIVLGLPYDKAARRTMRCSSSSWS